MIGSKIPRRYAKALHSIGQEDGNYEEYGNNLQKFSAFCSANEQFFQVISNKIFSVEDRKKILEVVLEKSHFTDVVKNFLRLLLDKDRVEAIRAISDYYATLTDDVLNITRADVITSRPLTNKVLGNLVKALKKLTSKEVKAVVVQDESIMGGLIVKIGDLVLDGSVRAQLEGLRESLKRGEYY